MPSCGQGNRGSATQDRDTLQRSVNIDRIIEEDSKKFKKERTILLLGKGRLPLPALLGQRKIERVWKINRS